MGDALRLIDAGLALVLVIACTYAVVLDRRWDGRIRFAMFGAFGVLLTAGHLATLGQPYSWRLPVLVGVVALALISTITFVRRELRAEHTAEDLADRAGERAAGVALAAPDPAPGPERGPARGALAGRVDDEDTSDRARDPGADPRPGDS